MHTNQNTSTKVPNEPESARSSPSSSEGPPLPIDGVSAGAADRIHPSKVHTPEGDPPLIKPLRFTAPPAEKALYKPAFLAAWEFPHDLMRVMSGVRTGIKRGKKAALRAGGQDR